MTGRASAGIPDGAGIDEGSVVATPGPEILNVPDAAALLRISDRTIRRLVRGDAIPYFRAGQQIRFVRAELMSWAIERSRQ
jgi:DNA binding domain, excisionase family